MGNLYNKHIKGSGILQTTSTPDFKNKYGKTQVDVMNKKGAAIKSAETNFNKLRTAFKGFDFDPDTAKRFQKADSINFSNLEKSYGGYNKSLDSINKVKKDYIDKILPNDSPNKMLSPETSPLLQGAYEQGDKFVPNLSDQVMMQGLQTLSANAAKAYSNPKARGEAQVNRAERREERSKKLRNQNNNKYTDPTSKFNLKTAEIKKRGEDNVKKANIDTKYKEWLMSRRDDSNNLPNNNGSSLSKEQQNLLNKPYINPITEKPYVGALTKEQKQAKIDTANAVKNINL